ncbi:hypothetical protein SCE1572_31140 [Sorangium cellulosum So0157-2]|uniref:Uncharacterized protein n=1 Tax=Sorangium cellulosum So0157-2 TaxID=1254432 RepID=S4Y242_SORCE|nr:hypothetical protein SCE1572_31140 [Sorangium cellulosum So0157-2]
MYERHPRCREGSVCVLGVIALAEQMSLDLPCVCDPLGMMADGVESASAARGSEPIGWSAHLHVDD